MIRKEEFYFPSCNGSTKLYGVVWKPEGQIKAILQISHGMIEHIGRYDKLATYLSERGILVTGNDHLGHGKSVNNEAEWGYFAKGDASGVVVDDLHSLTNIIKKQYPHVPYFILGFSMGSFMVRRYIMTYGEEVNGAIIAGTGNQRKSQISTGIIVVTLLSIILGEKYRSKLVDKLVFGMYNKRIKPTNTPKDWFCRDSEVVRIYRSDPACTYIFTLNGFKTLFKTIEFIKKEHNISKIPKSLPIFIISGEEDSVGNYGKAVRKVYDIYKKQGIKDVKMKLYPSDRHDIFNEADSDQVYTDLYDFILNNIVDK